MTKGKEEEPLKPLEASKEGSQSSSLDEERKKKIKKNILIIAPIVIAVVGAVLFYFFVIKGHKASEKNDVEQSKGKEQVQLSSNTYLDIDPIIVGLSPSGPNKEHLRLDLTLRLNTEEESAAVLVKMPVIKDMLITFLRTLRSSDFNSSSSTIYLKEEIAKRINKITHPIVIKEVLFQEITIS